VSRSPLTSQQLAQFAQIGVVRLPGFLPNESVAAMADAIWTDLHRRYGVERDRRDTWMLEPRSPRGWQALIRSGAFSPLATPELLELGDAFLGHGAWTRPKRWGQPLVTFPTGDWDVPHASWHIDLPASGSLDRLSVLRIFAFLEPVEPRGGGTAYVAGSHRAVVDRAREAGRDRLNSQHMRSVLKAEEPWLAELLTAGGADRVERFMRRWGEMRGHPVRVEEMTGEAGDVILMHPAMIHVGTPNALDRPRMMIVETFWRTSA
jgi:hypothetical protein